MDTGTLPLKHAIARWAAWTQSPARPVRMRAWLLASASPLAIIVAGRA